MLVWLIASNAQARNYDDHYRQDSDQNTAGGDRERRIPDVRFPPARGAGFGATVEWLIRDCTQKSADFAKWPLDPLWQIPTLDEARRNALEQLRTSITKAADTLAARCPKEAPATLPARLGAVADVADGLITALDGVKPAMEAFYNSLDDEQKAYIIARSTLDRGSASAFARLDHSNANSARRPEMADAQHKGICEQWMGALRSWPVRRIEAVIPLSDTQLAALYDVSAAIHRAAGDLTGSCPTETSYTPLGQLDINRKRVDALRQTINIIEPVLDRFLDTLSDEQKTRLSDVSGSKPSSRRRGHNVD
jgi:hypothetical protein